METIFKANKWKKRHSGGLLLMLAVLAGGSSSIAARVAAAPDNAAQCAQSAHDLDIENQAQSYFDSDDARKALATLAQAARKDPADRVIGAMLYGAVRDHSWHLPQILPVRHMGIVRALAFSPDGAQLATGSDYGEVRVFPTKPVDDTAAAAQQFRFKTPDQIVGVVFSKDGKRVAISSRAGWLRLWDFAGNNVVFTAPRADVSTTAFATAGNSNLCAVGMENGAIQVLDMAAGKLVAEPKQPGGKVLALAISRDGEQLAAASADGITRVWEISTGEQVGRELTHGAQVSSVDFSSDGRYVVVGGENGLVKMFDPESGAQVVPAMDCDAEVIKISVSPDGSMIAALLDDSSVVFWDAVSGKKMDFNLLQDAPFTDILWLRSGLRMATASTSGQAAIWSMRDGSRYGEAMPHDGPVAAIALNPDSRLFATGGQDGLVRIWRTDDGAPMPTVRTHNARVRTAFYSADGHDLVTASEDHTALHWVSGQVHPFGPALIHRGKVTCAVFDKAGKRILSCDDSGIAQLWVAATGETDGAPFVHKSPVNWVDFHPDGDRFVTASGPDAFIWSVKDRAKPLAVIKSPGKGKSELKSARFSPDGKLLVTASTDGTARIWNAATCKQMAVINRHAPVLCARFSIDGSLLVVGGEDGQAVVYDTRTWKPVGAPVVAPGPVFSAFITEDNRFLAMSSLLLNAVQFFQIDTGSPLGQGVPVPAQATCIDYLPQDKVVVVACDDSTVRAVGSPFVTEDVPPWMCDMAEKLAGLKLTDDGSFESVDSDFNQLRAYLTPEVMAGNEDFFRLTRWRLTMDARRPGMPRFTSTLADNIERRVDERSVDALLECYDALPGDPLVLAALSLYWPNARHGAYLADLVLSMPDASPLARCFAAGTLIADGRSADARVVMDKALADAPEDPQVLRRAAKFYARLLDKKTSVELFEKALAMEPKSFETRRSYAWALYNMNEPAKAATQFHLAEMIQGPMNSDLIAGLCLCAEAMKDDKAARAAFDRLLALDPAWKDPAYIAGLHGWTQREITGLQRIRGGP